MKRVSVEEKFECNTRRKSGCKRRFGECKYFLLGTHELWKKYLSEFVRDVETPVRLDAFDKKVSAEERFVCNTRRMSGCGRRFFATAKKNFSTKL